MSHSSDGLLDITHAADYVTVSNSFIHNHWKGSLVGHSEKNGAEDKGFLHVTYANNYWSDMGSRAPSIRFGTAHIFNNYYEDIKTSGVNTREGAEVLIESTVFDNVKRPVTAVDTDNEGTATMNDVELGNGEYVEEAAKLGTNNLAVEYEYTLLGSAAVKAAVVGTAGATLSL